jgi:hypothetical protein
VTAGPDEQPPADPTSVSGASPARLSTPEAEQAAVRRQAWWRDWRETAGLIRTWPPVQRVSGWWDDDPNRPTPWWLRLIALAVAIWLGILLALFAGFLTPYRIQGVLVPVSLVFVVAGLTAVTRFTYAVTRHVWLSIVPGVVWLIVSLILSGQTREGDLVLVSQLWVATVYLLVGSVTLGVLAYRMVVPRQGPRRQPPARPTPPGARGREFGKNPRS